MNSKETAKNKLKFSILIVVFSKIIWIEDEVLIEANGSLPLGALVPGLETPLSPH